MRRFFTSSDGKVEFDGEVYWPQPASRRDAELQAGPAAGDAQFLGAVTSSPHGISDIDIESGAHDDALVIQKEICRRRNKLLCEAHFFVERITQDGRTWDAELLTMARQLRQNLGPSHHRSCDALLGDGRCTVPPFEQLATVATVADFQRSFTFTGGGPFADNLWRFGRIAWLTGNNRGQSCRIFASTSGGVIQLATPTRFEIRAGDTGTLFSGCDGQPIRARTYNNILNFRGNQFWMRPKSLILSRGTVN